MSEIPLYMQEGRPGLRKRVGGWVLGFRVQGSEFRVRELGRRAKGVPRGTPDFLIQSLTFEFGLNIGVTVGLGCGCRV